MAGSVLVLTLCLLTLVGMSAGQRRRRLRADVKVDVKYKSVAVGDLAVIAFTEYLDERSCLRIPSIDLSLLRNGRMESISTDTVLRKDFEESGRFTVFQFPGKTCVERIYILMIYPVIMEDAAEYRIFIPSIVKLAGTTLTVVEPTVAPTTAPALTTRPADSGNDASSTGKECSALDMRITKQKILYVEENIKLVQAKQELVALQIQKLGST